MSHLNIVRAWKDRAFRQSLSEAERAQLPENPAGSRELTEAEAQAVEGQAGFGWWAQLCPATCSICFVAGPVP